MLQLLSQRLQCNQIKFPTNQNYPWFFANAEGNSGMPQENLSEQSRKQTRTQITFIIIGVQPRTHYWKENERCWE